MANEQGPELPMGVPWPRQNDGKGLLGVWAAGPPSSDWSVVRLWRGSCLRSLSVQSSGSS